MNLEDCGITKDEIIEKLVDRLSVNLREEASERIDQEVQKIFAKTAQEAILDRIGQVADRYIKTQYQPVNCWGEPVGNPTTVQDVIESTFKNWWGAWVDKSGKPVTSTHYGTKFKRAEYMASRVAEEVLSNRLKEEYGKVVQEAQSALAKELIKAIQQQIMKLVK